MTPLDLTASDGVVAFFLLNDCSSAFTAPAGNPRSPDILKAFHALMEAALAAGVSRALCDELALWLKFQPDCPRALVLAVLVGGSIPDEAVNRITDAHLSWAASGEKSFRQQNKPL